MTVEEALSIVEQMQEAIAAVPAEHRKITEAIGVLRAATISEPADGERQG